MSLSANLGSTRNIPLYCVPFLCEQFVLLMNYTSLFPYPNRSIDTSEALKVAGVFDVITAHDVPAANEFHFSDDPEIIFARNEV